MKGVQKISETRYRARIFIQGKYHHIGVFNNEEKAHHAYLEAELKAKRTSTKGKESKEIKTTIKQDIEKISNCWTKIDMTRKKKKNSPSHGTTINPRYYGDIGKVPVLENKQTTVQKMCSGERFPIVYNDLKSQFLFELGGEL